MMKRLKDTLRVKRPRDTLAAKKTGYELDIIKPLGIHMIYWQKENMIMKRPADTFKIKKPV